MNASVENIRVLLFDIDGTLLVPARRGVYREQVNIALIDIFGTSGKIDEIAFGGKTDLQILREALEDEGITPEQIRAQLPRIEQRFTAILSEMERYGRVFNCCPGVEELLARLSGDERFLLSLLTGNVESLAQAKLQGAGLLHYFTYRGAFGSDHEDRRLLPAIAAERIHSAFCAKNGREAFKPQQYIIIGDTPRDIACARYFGARVLAVATGNSSMDELAQEAPDLLLENLADTEKAIDALVSL